MTTPRQRIVVGVIALLAAIGGLFVYNRFFREKPPPYFASDEEHFLYGSVGTEPDQGVPYWIWLVLPRIFPEYLPAPGGYASIGILGARRTRDADRPLEGDRRLSARRHQLRDVPRRQLPRAAGTTCPTVYPAAASHQTGEQEYLRFLIACASDPRFTAGTILGEIARNTHLSFIDRMLYRFAIIPGTRRAMLRLRRQDGWMDQPARLGTRPHRSVQPGEVRHPAAADRRHDRQLRHDAAVERGAPRRHGVSLGWSQHLAARGGAVVGARRRRVATMGGARLREVERDRPEARCRACGA